MAERLDPPTPELRAADVANVQTVADLAILLRALRRREARRRHGAVLTYRHLAAQAGWSHGIVAAYLTGKILPPTDRFDLLVQLLGATPAEQGALATARDRVEDGRRVPPSPGRPAPARGGNLPAFRQLPADVPGFIGRATELADLDRLPATAGAAPTPVTVAVTGTAGVGKTALAVHWAHRVADRFPDGQLHIDLRGHSPAPPMRPLEALGQFLRALGVPPEQVPTDLQEAAGRYRSLLAGQRVLVVLDNARDADQVRPLLPGAPGGVALITSRDRLDGLVAREGARRLTLDVLTPTEAHALLASTVDADQTAPSGLAELARLCAYLPLALRIAAANLSDRRMDVSGYTEQLRSGGELTGLAVVGDDQTAVRSAFSLSYTALPGDAQRLFRLLGAVPGRDVTAPAAAAVAGVEIAAARRLLDLLAAAHLLQPTAPGRYACHDLLRKYATELAAAGPVAERTGAVNRLYDWYLATVDGAARLLYPEKARLPLPAELDRTDLPPVGWDDPARALAWLDQERHNLVLAVQHAAVRGPRPMAWRLADALRGHFYTRVHIVEWAAVCRAGLAAARAEQDLPGQAASVLSLGSYYYRRQQYPLALEHDRQAAELSRRAGWVAGQVVALTQQAEIYRKTGQLARAIEQWTLVIDLVRRGGRPASEAAILGNLGLACFEQGRLDLAVEYHTRGLHLDRMLGSRIWQAQTLINLGEVYLAKGRRESARECLTEARELLRSVGSPVDEAESARLLAEVHCLDGDYARACELAAGARDRARDAHDACVEGMALTTLATIHLRTGRPEQAVLDSQEALQLVRETGNRHPESHTHLCLAASYLAIGQPDLAAVHARQSLSIARAHSYRLLAERAAAALTAGPALPDAVPDAVPVPDADLGQINVVYRSNHVDLP